jgi:hypothetical protein
MRRAFHACTQRLVGALVVCPLRKMAKEEEEERAEEKERAAEDEFTRISHLA